jgi:aspartate-semialdehyde dehydrogenase
MRSQKIKVGVLGATGSVGQRFIQLLEHHPWFEVSVVTGSDRTVGEKYGKSCRWILTEAMPDGVKYLEVMPTLPVKVDVPLVFSALPVEIAHEAEPMYARAGIVVCSNASAYRQDDDVPLLLPEVNPEHTDLLAIQRLRRHWSGAICTNPNCTSAGLTITLKALQIEFGVENVLAVSMQALSGAGYPGVPALDILDNVIPFINGEEEKVEWEPKKILGSYKDQVLEFAPINISAHCNRVAVSDGHLVCFSVSFSRPANYEFVLRALEEYSAPEISRELPSSPRPVIKYLDEASRPQPRLDRLTGNGMTTVVGRLRPDPILDWKMVVLSHNTIRGAAGGSIYNAELLRELGFIKH